jgi:octaprenyl-diphosphate synthase
VSSSRTNVPVAQLDSKRKSPQIRFLVKNIKIYSEQDFPKYLPRLNSLYDDLFLGGKGFRAKLVQKVSGHLAVPDSAQHLLAQTVEFIHNASLLHDDLIDRSILRRGKPAAWNKYSPEYAVLAGDYLLARVMVNLSTYGNIRLVQYTAEVISELLEGEWLQDSVIRDFDVNLEKLDRIHNLKTASLFKWCLRAPFFALERNDHALHETLEKLGQILGLLFQRSDDLLDYNIRNSEGKAILGDLKSGYLNSFGAFAAQGLSAAKRSDLVKSQTLDEFKTFLGGTSFFEDKVKKFDEINQKQIDLYHHLLSALKDMIKPNELGLLEDFKPLTDLLYWRRT